MSRGYGWRGGCSAAAVTDAGVGSVAWLGIFVFEQLDSILCLFQSHLVQRPITSDRHDPFAGLQQPENIFVFFVSSCWIDAALT